jgi:hypothetical protein
MTRGELDGALISRFLFSWLTLHISSGSSKLRELRELWLVYDERVLVKLGEREEVESKLPPWKPVIPGGLKADDKELDPPGHVASRGSRA